MTKYWPHSPGDTIKSAEDNADKEGLANGSNDYANNSIFLFRNEAFASFFTKNSSVWVAGAGRVASANSGFIYEQSTGDRIAVPAQSAHTFAATNDTYCIVDGVTGLWRYAAGANAATAPDISSTEHIAAIVVTDANNITMIIQGGLDNRGRYVYNTAPITKDQVSVDVGLPTGMGFVWFGEANTLPAGCIIADGSALSRSTYSRLFSIIGTAYGAGDGSTTFNVPNLNGRVPVGRNGGTFNALGQTGGEERHTQTGDELVYHGHGVYDPGHSHSGGALYFRDAGGGGNLNMTGGGNRYAQGQQPLYINGSGSNIGIYGSGGGQPMNILQPFLTTLWVIRII